MQEKAQKQEGKKWLPKELRELKKAFKEGKTDEQISKEFTRSVWAVKKARSRIGATKYIKRGKEVNNKNIFLVLALVEKKKITKIKVVSGSEKVSTRAAEDWVRLNEANGTPGAVYILKPIKKLEKVGISITNL